MAFRLRADDGPAFNVGLVALCSSRGSGPVLLTNPIALSFSRVVRTPVSPSGSALVISLVS